MHIWKVSLESKWYDDFFLKICINCETNSANWKTSIAVLSKTKIYFGIALWWFTKLQSVEGMVVNQIQYTFIIVIYY